MTAELPPETRPGHAEDCAACLHGWRPDPQPAAPAPGAADNHTRRPPPTQPRLPRWPIVVVFVGLICAANTWNGAVFGLVGIVIMLPAVIAWGYLTAEWRTADRRWRADHEEWKAEQTRLWLSEREKGGLWYCPTCAELSCSGQHPDAEAP